MNVIYLIGDSTCHTNKDDTYPQKGWGQYFSDYLKPKFKVINLAENGRSSKSFRDEGLFNPCLENISEGDYLFIQFGHNDEKVDLKRHTEPFSTYQANLLYYINVARKARATPVLLSSIYRRHFKDGIIEENCHLEYPKAMKELAQNKKVIFIDMCELTKECLIKKGDEKSKEFFMNFGPDIYSNYPEGKNDNSHLREKGARAVCLILVSELQKNNELKVLLK